MRGINMNYEKIVHEVIAFATEKTRIEFEKFVKNNKDVKAVYAEFIVNRHVSYMDVIDMIKKNKDLPKEFKEKFIEYHKEFGKKKQQISKENADIVAQIDKFTIINKYKDLSRDDTYQSFKAVKEFIKQVVETIKAKGFDSIIYGNIYLKNPRNPKSIAEYNYVTDDISLKLYRNYSGHAFESVVHELMHRIWVKLMTRQDMRKWEDEFDAKKSGIYKGKYPGFPNDYSKTETIEYHAEVLTEYIQSGKKYSELVDEII
jgi:hypothetical protein